MDMSTQDCVKKALLDTQERIRDFMAYADHIKDRPISKYFREYAESEGFHAQDLQEFLEQS